MNAHKNALFTALLALGIATAAQAQGTMSMSASDKKDAPKDSMAMSGMMMAKPAKHDKMKHDGMKNDAMKHDAMKSDAMAAPSH